MNSMMSISHRLFAAAIADGAGARKSRSSAARSAVIDISRVPPTAGAASRYGSGNLPAPASQASACSRLHH
jgi:hypothetical protein